MNIKFRPEDLVVRPFFRVAGALLLACLIFVLVTQGLALVQVDFIAPSACPPNKHRLLCELGNLVLKITPDRVQGPLAATAHMVLSMVLAWAMWWLVMPLVKRQ